MNPEQRAVSHRVLERIRRQSAVRSIEVTGAGRRGRSALRSQVLSPCRERSQKEAIPIERPPDLRGLGERDRSGSGCTLIRRWSEGSWESFTLAA
jgi:hypothetical protein